MSAAVNLLLLLSALLSALTGVSASVRQPQPAVVVQQASPAARVRVSIAAQTRPGQGLPRLATVAAMRLATLPVRIAREPIYLTRLRE